MICDTGAIIVINTHNNRVDYKRCVNWSHVYHYFHSYYVRIRTYVKFLWHIHTHTHTDLNIMGRKLTFLYLGIEFAKEN